MRPGLKKIIEEMIKKHTIDLSGLVVLTEAASGSYLYNPILAALAGAEKIIAIAADSRYAKAADVIVQTRKVAEYFNIEDKIILTTDKSLIDYSQIDIITNTGFVRPINEEMIRKFKKTAVVPLMWETWEYRGDEIDLQACKNHEILTLGTNESHTTLDLIPYVDRLILKLLFELGLSGYKDKIILIASDKFGARLNKSCEKNNIDCTWFSHDNKKALSPCMLEKFLEENSETIDAIIIAELKSDKLILGKEGLLDPQKVMAMNSDIKIGIIAGNVSEKEIDAAGMFYLPKVIAPPQYVSYQIYQFGIRPVMDLFAAGLKVGQIMSRLRQEGLSIQETVKGSIANSAAMDYEGDLSWL